MKNHAFLIGALCIGAALYSTLADAKAIEPQINTEVQYESNIQLNESYPQDFLSNVNAAESNFTAVQGITHDENHLDNAPAQAAKPARARMTNYTQAQEAELIRFWDSISSQIEAGAYSICAELNDTSIPAQTVIDYGSKRYFIGYPVLAEEYSYSVEGGRYVFRTSLTENNKMVVSTTKAVREYAKARVAGMQPTIENVKALYNEMANIVYDNGPNKMHGAYDFLVGGSMKCDGFSKLYMAELEELGIEAYYIMGYVDGCRHAWNGFVLNGTVYAADGTMAEFDLNAYFNARDNMTVQDRYIIEDIM